MIGSDATHPLGLERFCFQGSPRADRKPAACPDHRKHWVRSGLLRSVFLLLLAVAGTFGLSGCAKKETMVVVPDVSQQDPDQAQRTLAASKLKPGSITGATGAGAYVASQSPAAGQQVAANSPVDLVVELPVMVPALAGSNLTDAVMILQGLGLRIAFVKKPTVNPFGKTKVEQQDPAANSLVHRNTMVTLMVSTPPDIGALLGLAAKEPAYQKLKPEYKNVLDAFLGNPSTPRSMDSPSTPSTPNSPSTPTK
jgi:beta-lactam-binding protein with PASTA domain